MDLRHDNLKDENHQSLIVGAFLAAPLLLFLPIRYHITFLILPILFFSGR
jgi:hypothetical protein